MKETINVPKNSGFTLWELMTVIGIMAVLSATVLPNFIAWLPKYKLGSAARDLLSAMQHARLTAVKNNANVQVIFYPDRNNYKIFTDYDGDRDQDADEPTIRKSNMPAGVDLKETNFTNDTLNFNSMGLASGSGGTISIANIQDKLTKIRISRTGNSRILRDDED
jgi:type IV fimbrial biogenesis protein FimT